MVWPNRAFQEDKEEIMTYTQDPRAPVAAQQDVPASAQDAQSQAYIEEAQDEAKAAEKKAEDAKLRAEKYEKDMAEQKDKAKSVEEDKRPRDAFGSVIVQPGDVVSSTGVRNIPMETTEDDRLIRHKAMVRDHLRNADPDMTGGTGEDPAGEPELDPSTGLPVGHVPEGHQDQSYDPVLRR